MARTSRLFVTALLAASAGFVGYGLGPRLGKRMEHMLDRPMPGRAPEVNTLLRAAERGDLEGWNAAQERLGSGNRDSMDVQLARYLMTLRRTDEPPPAALGDTPQMAQALAAWVRGGSSEREARKRRAVFAKRFPRSWLTRAWRLSGKLDP